MDSKEVIVTFKWPYEGSSVEICGSFSNWQERWRLHKEDGVWTTRLRLSPAIYHYKFIIDGHNWYYDIMKQHINDNGNVNNVIKVEPLSPVLEENQQKPTSEPIKFEQKSQKQPPLKVETSVTDPGQKVEGDRKAAEAKKAAEDKKSIGK